MVRTAQWSMSENRREEQDFRLHMAMKDVSPVKASRSEEGVRAFIPDHCADCQAPLPPEVKDLFCSQLCLQRARDMRYWRSTLRDGRLEQPDVQEALNTKLAFLVAGGYAATARRLPLAARKEIVDRDGGRCVQCGNPGEEIDHIDGDSADPTNLQLLCKDCHSAKTQASMVPASAESIAMVEALQRDRVKPDQPALLCDDEQNWELIWRLLTRERALRLEGSDPAMVLGPVTGLVLLQRLLENPMDLDYATSDTDGPFVSNGMDDDSGYGPDSYFARTLAKDD